MSEEDDVSSMTYWADVKDNRVGPILRELVEAISEIEDAEKIKRISVRLKFLSGCVNSYANRAGEKRD